MTKTERKFTYPGALPEDLREPKPATEKTATLNTGILNELPFDDRHMFENARRGFIATLDPLTITRPDDGRKTYDLSDMSFLNDDAPATVNPSLWRQARLNALHHGLYEVVDGIYQVRSFDLAHMTLVRGETGWIIIDPLTSAESSRTALDLAGKHLGNRPVKAVIFTHSHVDHFGGVSGVIGPDDVAAGRVMVIAPAGFVEAALSENVLAGNVMRRRATYMYGNFLPHSPRGFITNGLGALLSMGTIGFAVPTDIVRQTGETRVIDGVEVVFQMTPDSEAVSEFIFYFPRFKALCMSEITTHHLHNVYTPRGAQIRDALAWAGQINEAIDLFGDRLEVQFGSHHWPLWGREEVLSYLKKQRDLYKYIHDQTLRLANHGYTMEEIAEQLELPDSLAKDFSCRDYYGTVRHNAKAVYVKYLGYFNGNPSTLNALPPARAAGRYVEYMGGAEAITEKAREDFDRGEYRWVAEVMNHVVMADPENIRARALLADTYEQLGYQSESGPWRNFYLSGAYELRHGVPESSPARLNEGTIRAMPLENLFQALAVRLNGPKAGGKGFAFNIFFTDMEESYVMSVEHGVLNFFRNKQASHPTAAMRLTSLDFKRMMTGLADPASLMAAGSLELEGNLAMLAEFAGLLDQFTQRFPVVTPRDQDKE
jgi:alkyl sulfatase BDS1-like metallo-beta-lactamase superfamily hydrolase